MPPAKAVRAWGPGEAGAGEGPVLGEGEEARPLQAPGASPAVVPPAWLPRGDDTGDLIPSLASRPRMQRFGVGGGIPTAPALARRGIRALRPDQEGGKAGEGAQNGT